jgi:hypothetical protein
MISPFCFPVTAATFNFACVIFGTVTVFAILTWYFTPADQWLSREQLELAMCTAEGSVEMPVNLADLADWAPMSTLRSHKVTCSYD